MHIEAPLDSWDECYCRWADYCWDFGDCCLCWRLEFQVGCWSEYEAEMAEVAPSEGSWDGSCIGINLSVQEMNGHGGWGNVGAQLGELFVGENLDEVRVGDRHDAGR